MPFLRYCVERKCDDTDNVLLLGVQGHLNIWHLPMASRKLNIILLYMGVYGHLKIGHTLNTSYNDMLN